MAPAVAQLLFLQLVLGPAPVVNIKVHPEAQNFHNLHIDYPKVTFAEGFQGYCNGFMAYVRGRRQNWFCPKVHYVLHAPWKDIQKFCNYTDYFCDVYNEYCTLTRDFFWLTTCTLDPKHPSTGCSYTTSVTRQRVYLVCSRRYKGSPIGIISLI
ncbi:Ribonuclease-like protein 13 [Heterocephalus glaber]|uniref:Ribonuclease-like protein 13 n=1 Tax=Heterocephalus glaber TaxID=10181 RepID=G5BFW2_HETGA|nr:probable inactive ribonuclease-like protein 13 [Heterocephalus glaber]EHB08173.1 Ribonuclease-like protein 13 [Heterocephalus glaber]